MIILDTHVWIWAISDPDRLSRKAAREIEKASQRGIAAISCWELATLAEKQRIRLDRSLLDWMEQSIEAMKLDLLPLTPAVAALSSQLGAGFHGDPADRQIVATAMIHNAQLVTKDERIQAYGSVKSIW